jgi:predicted transcriptional regulator
MMNAGNVENFDKILSHLIISKWGQLEMKDIIDFCNGNDGLAEIIIDELEIKGFVRLAKCYEGVTVILISKGKAKLFLEQGGFRAAYEQIHPTKTRAQKLNDHFCFIMKEEGYIPLENYPKYSSYKEEEQMNNILVSYSLAKQENDWIMPTNEGRILSYSGNTIQEFMKDKTNIIPSTVNNTYTYNGTVIEHSEFNHSPVKNSSKTISTTNTGEEENPKYKNWKMIGAIISGLITAIAAALKIFL